MTIEIVDFPFKNGGSFHSYVSLPEGNGVFFFFLRELGNFLRARRKMRLKLKRTLADSAFAGL